SAGPLNHVHFVRRTHNEWRRSMVRSCRWMSGVRLAVAVGMVMVGLTPAPLPAAAAVGDLLRTVVLPAGGGPEGEFCISGVGTSVASVRGASAALPRELIRLGTACHASPCRISWPNASHPSLC